MIEQVLISSHLPIFCLLHINHYLAIIKKKITNTLFIKFHFKDEKLNRNIKSGVSLLLKS
jgi:hypothetical protein